MTTSMEETCVTFCDICLEGVLAKDQIFLRGCHVHNGNFHQDCVAKWVYEQSEELKVEPVTCPTCRQPLPKEQTTVMLTRGIELMAGQQPPIVRHVRPVPAAFDMWSGWFRTFHRPRGEVWDSIMARDPETVIMTQALADELFHFP
jgi:hypothetical protein